MLVVGLTIRWYIKTGITPSSFAPTLFGSGPFRTCCGTGALGRGAAVWSPLVVPHAEFERYLQSHGRVAFLLTRQLVVRLRDADRKRIEFLAQDTVGRVCSRLVELAERFGEAGDGGTHIDLAII